MTTIDLGAVSAYALAVKYGFAGTEEEWVAAQQRLHDESAASAAAAAASAGSAGASASESGAKLAEASVYAGRAKSYAVGTDGEVRENDNSDNAAYYYEQSKRISQSLNGVIPMGTITFDGLSDANNQSAGYMFNISVSFVSDGRFADGGGIFYGAGSNVLYTADGKWDVLAASMVSGVKGSAETEYRQGFVNIGKADVGLGNVGNFKAVSASPQTLTADEQSAARANIGAGTSSFSGSYSDLSGKPESLPANGGNADRIGGYRISVVSELPSGWEAHTDTIYFVKQ